jgi:acetylornithine/N-succinyldiaminopimelate aminotransferase
LTYGGNPLACAVAGAVLDIVTETGFLAGIAPRAQALREGLDSIGRRYGVFAPSRGLGLLIGAPMSEAWKGRAKEIVNAGLKRGVWTLVAGPDVLRVAPSLIIGEAELAEGLRRLEAGVAELVGATKAA